MVEHWLKLCTVILQNSGDERLAIIRQIKVHFARLHSLVETVVYMQKDAPVPTLIVTDLLAQQGLIV